MSLTNKIALVTGGSRGIGAAIVRRLAADGAKVAFTYGKSAEAAEALAKETGAKAYQADAAQIDSAAELADKVVEDFGGLDILVNNAGVGSSATIGDVDMKDYRHTMAVNVDGVFALTNAAIKYMKPGSRIINISSILGERAAIPGMSSYNGSKFAVIGLTRSWAKDMGDRGILINAVLPGPINTDMNPDDGGDQSQFMRANTALGRYGTVEEISGAVAFLAGPDATYISGTTLTVDGGWNA